MGVELALPRDLTSRKQLRGVDVATLLPRTTDLLPLLQESFAQGYDTAASMLLRSPNLEGMDILVARDLAERGFVAGLTESLKVLLSLRKCDKLGVINHLLQAVDSGWVEIVQLLLDSKVDVNARINGTTVLHAAAEHGNVDIAKLLLKHGAHVDAESDVGRTALHLAAAAGYPKIVMLLFMNKPDVNHHDTEALSLAARGGHLDVVKFLLEHKVDGHA